jgi:hypothetical protein
MLQGFLIHEASSFMEKVSRQILSNTTVQNSSLFRCSLPEESKVFQHATNEIVAQEMTETRFLLGFTPNPRGSLLGSPGSRMIPALPLNPPVVAGGFRPTESREGKRIGSACAGEGKRHEAYGLATSLLLVRREHRLLSASHVHPLTEAHLSGTLHHSWSTNYYATRNGERTMVPRQTDKRERLIQTAVTLVHQQGFHQTTLADIA